MSNSDKRVDGHQRFLLIDDDTDDREMFGEALASIDPAIVFDNAVNGSEALEGLLHKKIVEPDIIFLDLNMPGMNGWECLRQLKSEDAYKHIPVIVYSTSANKKDRVIAHSLGALCFITKPNAYRHLQDMLGVVVENVRRKSFHAICEEVKALALS